MAAKNRLLLISNPNPIELLVLPPNTAPQTAVPPPAISNRSKKTAPPAVPPSSAIAIYPQAAAAEIAGAAVDWVQETQAVAADMAKKSAAERRQESAAPPRSPFALPPAHHKGEQFPTGDGRWIVYV
jgi:hypothetical protein